METKQIKKTDTPKATKPLTFIEVRVFQCEVCGQKHANQTEAPTKCINPACSTNKPKPLALEDEQALIKRQLAERQEAEERRAKEIAESRK